jgi:hypothetical protein
MLNRLASLAKTKQHTIEQLELGIALDARTVDGEVCPMPLMNAAVSLRPDFP